MKHMAVRRDEYERDAVDGAYFLGTLHGFIAGVLLGLIGALAGVGVFALPWWR